MAKILDFVSYKNKRDDKPEPLVVTPEGKITTKAGLLEKRPEQNLASIRASMAKIDRLMAELKELTRTPEHKT